MALVSYPQDLRAEAVEKKRHLATVAVAGVEWQGVVTDQQRDKLLRFYLDFVEEVTRTPPAPQPQPAPEAGKVVAR